MGLLQVQIGNPPPDDTGEAAQKKAVADFARMAAKAAVKEGKGFDLAQARAAWAAVGEGTAQANESPSAVRHSSANDPINATTSSISSSVNEFRGICTL